MRLLIVGTFKGQLTTATKIAMDSGAAVTHAEDHDQALRRAARRQGRRPADGRRRPRHPRPRDRGSSPSTSISRSSPAASSNNARAAVAAIHAGAKEYIPLPPDPELIAAVLAAVADDSRELIYRDDAMAQGDQARARRSPPPTPRC